MIKTTNNINNTQIELYLAEEAVGLVRSLNWEVVKGPMWKNDEST